MMIAHPFAAELDALLAELAAELAAPTDPEGLKVASIASAAWWRYLLAASAPRDPSLAGYQGATGDTWARCLRECDGCPRSTAKRYAVLVHTDLLKVRARLPS